MIIVKMNLSKLNRMKVNTGYSCSNRFFFYKFLPAVVNSTEIKYEKIPFLFTTAIIRKSCSFMIKKKLNKF